MTTVKKFKVVAVSENTNSFGLKQMVMVAKDGSSFRGCFNSLNVRNKDELISGVVTVEDNGKELRTEFTGGELVEKLLAPPLETVNAIWK
jgi:hypothetical protein